MSCLGRGNRATSLRVFARRAFAPTRASSENHLHESSMWRGEGQGQLSHSRVAMGTRVHKRFLSRVELEFE